MTEAKRKQTFAGSLLAARAAIVFAGPLANLLSADLVFSALAYCVGDTFVAPRIGAVLPGGAVAAAAGFAPGDPVRSVNDRPIGAFDELFVFVSLRPGEPIRFGVERAGHEITLIATPIATAVETPFGSQRLGRLGAVASSDAENFRLIRPGARKNSAFAPV
jgi:regulator of sigma E protease